MFKHARELFFLSMALFFLSLAGAAIYATSTIFDSEGKWAGRVLRSALESRGKQSAKGNVLAEKVVDRLLANDGKLVVRIAQQILKPAVGTPAVGTPAVGTPAVGTPATSNRRNPQTGAHRLVQRTIDRLLDRDGELLATILAKMNAKRKNPIQAAFERLLAHDGALLTKVLIRMSAARKRPDLPKMLLKNPKVIAKVLSEVLTHLGVKQILHSVKAKVRNIDTRVSLQREIRFALGKLPYLVTKTMELKRRQKSVSRKIWRKIKAQYPKIRAGFQKLECLRLLRLRRLKKGQLRAVVRIKMLPPHCRKLSCPRAVQSVDQAILKWTARHGLHEGNIQIRFGLLRRKCNR